MRACKTVGLLGLFLLCFLGLEAQSPNALEDLRAGTRRAGSYLEKKQWESAATLLDSLQPLAFATESAGDKAQWFLQQGILHIELSKHSLADYYLLRSLQLFQTAHQTDSLGRPLLELTRNSRILGEYDKGATCAFQALEIFTQNQDSNRIAKTKEELGYLYQDHGELSNAMELFSENLAYYQFRNDTAGIAFSLGNIAMCDYDLEDYTSAIERMEKALALFQLIGDEEGQSEILNNIALPYLELKQYEKARNYLEASLTLFPETNNPGREAITLSNIGDVELEMGNLNEAMVYFEQAYALSQKYNLPFGGLDYHYNLHEVYYEKGDFETALDHYYSYTELQDSLFSERKTRIIQELELKYNTAQKEQELYEASQTVKLLEQEKQLTRTRIAVGLLALGVAVALLLIFLNRKRLEQQKHLALAQKEEEIARMKLTAAQEKLAESNQKLEGFTRNLLEKNWLISQMEEQIGELQAQSDEEANEKARKMEELLQLKILTDEDWRHYKSLFTEVHPGFLPALSKQFPSLTEGDQRYLMLLKLGIPGKEMAGILGVSQSSIRVSRFRIRKKMELGEEGSLKEVVEGIG